MPNNDQRRFLGLDQSDNVIEAIFSIDWFLGFLLGVFTSRDGSRSRRKTSFLLLLRLRPIFMKKLKQLTSCVLVESV